MIKNKKPTKEEVHQIINWVVTISLLMFALWVLNMYINTRQIIKEDRQLFHEVKMRLDKTNESLQETRKECELKVLPEMSQAMLN